MTSLIGDLWPLLSPIRHYLLYELYTLHKHKLCIWLAHDTTTGNNHKIKISTNNVLLHLCSSTQLMFDIFIDIKCCFGCAPVQRCLLWAYEFHRIVLYMDIFLMLCSYTADVLMSNNMRQSKKLWTHSFSCVDAHTHICAYTRACACVRVCVCMPNCQNIILVDWRQRAAVTALNSVSSKLLENLKC